MIQRDGIVFLTSDEMREADRAATEEFGIPIAVLMENAGMKVAELARRTLTSVEGKSVVCLVGKGNNGGDGLVAARHLVDWGAKVSLVLGAPKSEIREVPAAQLKTLEGMGVDALEDWEGAGEADLVVDALLGYNSRGNPRETVARLIRQANSSGVPVLAVDVPSGLDSDSGVPNEPCILARATLTLGWPKVGFIGQEARALLGELWLADISMPTSLYLRYSATGSPFRDVPLIRVW